MKYLTLFLLFFSLNALSQNSDIFHIDSLPTEGVLLDKGWKWHAGDNPDFAKADFDDSAWESIDPTKDIFELAQLDKANGQIGWFRIRLSLNAALRQQLAMQLNQSGASEIYLNGELIHRFGVISPNPAQIEAFTPNGGVLSFPRSTSPVQVLAVRYALQPHIRYGQHFGTQTTALSIRLNTVEQGVAVVNQQMLVERSGDIFVGVLGILTILFLAFFLFFPARKESLYFAIYALGQAISWSIFNRLHVLTPVGELFLRNNVFLTIQTISYLFLLQSVYTTLAQKRGWLFWGLMLLGMVAIWCGIYVYGWGWYVFAIGVTTFVNLDATRVALVAARKNQKGAWIIVAGGCVYLVCWLFFQLIDLNYLPPDLRGNFFLVSYLSIPVSFAIFFGYDSGLTNRILVQKLTEVETLSAEKQHILSTQNETLEKQVIERTAELVHKNRDLEIEAALEKVRARSLEMQRSDELKEVVATLYEQLRHLDFQYGAACIFIMDKETNDLVQWVSGFNQSEYPIGYYIKYFNHPVWEAQFTAWKNGDKYIELLLEGEEKKAFDEYMFTQTDFKNFPEQGKAFMQSLPSVVFSLAFLKHGALQWGPEKLNDEQAKILQKFAVVFEQAYTRFLDLQKAEAQARESQIEVALERVRSRTMAMQKSDELTEVAGILFKQVTDMGIKLWTAGFNVWSEDNNSYVDYMGSPNGVFTEPYTVYTDTAEALTDVSNARKSGVEFDVQYVEGEKLKQLYLAISKLDEKQFEIMLEEGIWIPSHQYEHFVFGSKVSLMFITYEPVPEAHDIFKRFGKVFEQTYTRFLDLQKAEAQAREAQIEAALERVRSRTMAMQRSKELAETASLLFKQVIGLGVNAFAITFQFWLEDGISTTCWTSVGVGDGMQPSFRIPHTEEPFHHQIYKAWKKGEDFFVMETEGKELEDVYRYVAMQMDEEVLNIMENSEFSIPKFQVVHCVFFLQGYIMFMTYERTPEAHDIFKRFGKVFEQSYTRFLDLQKAEAQADQAHLDLIQIQTEKKRAEDTLIELRATQTQLIQKEKLASLGELTAGIAHEIQNPLNFVNNFSELSVDLVKDLKEEIEKPTIDKEYVDELFTDLSQNQEKINHHGKRASSIVKGMLEHSRASTGVRELTDINKLADEYLRLSYHGMRAKDKDFNADFTTDFDENLPKIEVIPQDIGRVLLNLINNAFYAVNERQKAPQPPEGETYVPTVIVSTHYEAPPSGAGGAQIIIKVKDNGIGMPESVRAKVFQPFFTTKPTGQGTGLGLSLAYDIVTKGHGGILEVESMEGYETEFIIRLPYVL